MVRVIDVADRFAEFGLEPAGEDGWFQPVPLITYRLDDQSEPSLTIIDADDNRETRSGHALSEQESAEIFARTGRIRGLELTIRREMLFTE